MIINTKPIMKSAVKVTLSSNPLMASNAGPTIRKNPAMAVSLSSVLTEILRAYPTTNSST